MSDAVAVGSVYKSCSKGRSSTIVATASPLPSGLMTGPLAEMPGPHVSPTLSTGVSGHDCSAIVLTTTSGVTTGATGVMANLPLTGAVVGEVGELTGEGTGSCTATRAASIVTVMVRAACHVVKACKDLDVLPAGRDDFDE